MMAAALSPGDRNGEIIANQRDACHDRFSSRKEKRRILMDPAFWVKPLAMTYSCMASATLPSARLRFTSEFGMGSGGSTTLWSPGRRLEGSQRKALLELHTRTLSRSVLRNKLWT